MTKPTFVLAPGAWHKPNVYSRVMEILTAHGYSTIGQPLPSTGAMPPNMTFDEDVKAIRDALTKLVVTEEKEVILVVHSYTGIPGAEAPKSLGRKERQQNGLKGGVVRLVFIMAYAMPEGFQLTASGPQWPEWMKLDLEKGIVTVDPEDARKIFYHDLSPAEADDWASKLTHQSLGVYSSTQTHAAWRHIPSTYVVGEQDRTALMPQAVEMMLDGAKRLEPGAFDVVERCDGGHCLMISRPLWLSEVLRRAAGEVFWTHSV